MINVTNRFRVGYLKRRVVFLVPAVLDWVYKINQKFSTPLVT